jgi:DHA1 family tetracycline resistance protein-like MFS transporter
MSPLGVVVAIVLVDLLGFTVVMPLLAPFARQYQLVGWQIGLLFAAYPMCQLVAGPVLGRLSDRYGRRPVLIASQAGTAASFLILGLARDFPTMLLARMLDGASGGNILVAQAYVADVTAPEDRARGLGLIGMAFGIGFVLGPLLGGLLLWLPVAPDWRLRVPFLVGAGFSAMALVLVLTRLPESLPADAPARKAARVLTWHGLVETVTHPTVGLLVGVGFLVVLSFAALEGTYSLFLRERVGWGPQRAAFGFALLGLVSALVQGGLIRHLVPRFGEPRLIAAGVTTLAFGLALLALARAAPALLGATLVVAIGHGLASPTVPGLLSRVTPPGEQGGVFGALSSAQMLARMVGYLVANTLFARSGPSSPFWQACATALLALGLAMVVARRVAAETKVEAAVPGG